MMIVVPGTGTAGVVNNKTWPLCWCTCKRSYCHDLYALYFLAFAFLCTRTTCGYGAVPVLYILEVKECWFFLLFLRGENAETMLQIHKKTYSMKILHRQENDQRAEMMSKMWTLKGRGDWVRICRSSIINNVSILLDQRVSELCDILLLVLLSGLN